MAPRLLPLCALLALLAACGADEQPAAPAPTATELIVRVDRDGPRGAAPARELSVRCKAGDRSRACRAAEGLEPADFEPLPGGVACTDIFGGPQTARISGTLRGDPVSATFSRANGCEIRRWDAVAGLLEQVR